ncbi:KIR protein [Plasmodium coatneyi]|uniref:KIR protein n=1 Tax=Plasmodium coatneyi TaxID=208452 RepID=A0A1B1E4Z7_9APIC|nr:KIR protein [Plasmodium coatneyi]ANQ10078.1 KIR protein [Plasmodium coatneyi]
MSGSSGKKKLYCSKTKNILDRHKEDLKSKLGDLRNDESLVDDILRAWCCVSDTYPQDLQTGGGCDLLYYVIGSIIHRKLDDKDSFDGIMNAVYTYLGSMLSAGKCKDRESSSGKELFELMEKWSHYTLIPMDMWQEKVESGRMSCGRCSNYLRKIAEVCETVKSHCRGSHSGSTECRGITEEKTQGSPEYLLQLIYNIIPEPPPAESGGPGADNYTAPSPDSTLTDTINNISYGLLGTASLFITFFFYKYISLFPSPRRNSSKGRRRGRGRFVSHNSDTFTENDGSTIGSTLDNSMEYSTDTSTIGPTEYSIPYISQNKLRNNSGKNTQ